MKKRLHLARQTIRTLNSDALATVDAGSLINTEQLTRLSIVEGACSGRNPVIAASIKIYTASVSDQ